MLSTQYIHVRCNPFTLALQPMHGNGDFTGSRSVSPCVEELHSAGWMGPATIHEKEECT